MHNRFVDTLLLYKGMKPLRDMLADWTLRTRPSGQVHYTESDTGVSQLSSLGGRDVA